MPAKSSISPAVTTLIEGKPDRAIESTTRSRPSDVREEKPDLVRLVSLVIMHLGCLGVFWVGWSWTAVTVAFVFYVVRAFGLTAFYHRYFSHRSFKTSRWFQFAGATLGCLALQKGPLWWAAHHRQHHKSSDHDGDVHSPHVDGVLWSHMGWFLTPKNNRLRNDLVRDWLKFPELKWLDRLSPLVAVVFGVSLYAFGESLNLYAPWLGTNGLQMFVWVFFVSTVALYHATYCVNSLAHLRGSRRYETADSSRNNLFVAIITLGEGWHNNHHYYPSSARQGFFWWEIDVTYYTLILLSKCGIVWGIRPVPRHVLEG